MKRIYTIIVSLLLASTLCFAQTPSNRTVKTVVIDAISQLPAKDVKTYNSILEELGNTGHEGVYALFDMLNAPGKGDNSKVEYAINGLVHYVQNDGMEPRRLVLSKALLNCLDKTMEPEIKAFLIRQVQSVGAHEAVGKLSTYLTDPYLYSPATSALVKIGSSDASKEIAKAVDKAANDQMRATFINALGYLKTQGEEDLILKYVNSSNVELSKTAMYALSKVGTTKSLPVLSAKAAQANYTMDKGNATDSYLNLLSNMLNKRDILSLDKNSAALVISKDVTKEATELLKKSVGKEQTQIAAQRILMRTNPETVTKIAVASLKNQSNVYRNAILDGASKYTKNKSELYTAIVKVLPKSKVPVKLDLIRWIGRESDCPANNKYSKSLALPTLLNELNSTNTEVAEAAGLSLSRFDDKRVNPALANLVLRNPDLGKKLISSYGKGSEISQELVKLMPKADDKAKVAILESLASRKSDASLDAVMENLNSPSATVKAAAYKALKNVVAAKDAEKLYSMLGTVSNDNVPDIQNALVSAISTNKAEDNVKSIAAQMANASAEKKPLYYKVLASTGDENALKLISESLKSNDVKTRDAAFDALLSWEGTDATESLYKVLQDKNTPFFDKAIDRYIVLANSNKLTGENRRMLFENALDVAKTDNQKNAILRGLGKTNSYIGMLLAGNYLDNKGVQDAAGLAVMDIAISNKYTGENVEALLKKASSALTNPDAQYQRQAITKYLNEMTKEKGYVSIFNGKDLSGWKGLVGNPISRKKMTPAALGKAQAPADVQMAKDWRVEDGCIVYYGTGYNNLCTSKDYGDVEMYIDWRLDPEGKEPDAGIYLRGTPQIQIWDISRTDVGAEVGSGGLYNNSKNPSKPSKVADNKLGEWNTMYIKMVGDRVTVKLNGELVVDNIILENYWDRSQPIPAFDQIELQAHGSIVHYKNIYVKELERPEPFKLSAQERKEGYQILFDGTNMHEWTGNTVDYIIEDACISLHPSSRFGGNLYTKKEFDNFTFRFEFQLTAGANNGLGIRTPLEGDAAYVGMEVQILDHDDPIYKDITPLQVHGSVYGVIGAKREGLKPIGEWNYQEVTIKGDDVKVTLNGIVILEGNLKKATKDGAADGLDHPGVKNKKGHIAFLGHGSPVKFKNIRIKQLK